MRQETRRPVSWRGAGLAVAGAGAVALLAACGSSGPAGSAAPATVTVTASPPAAGGTSSAPATAPSAPVPASSPITGGTPACAASSLQARLTGSNGAAGTIFETVTLTNTSSRTCALFGFPGVSLVTGDGGSQIGAPATRSPVHAAAQVTLRPGTAAQFTVGVAQAANFPAATCQPVPAAGLRVYPPGSFTSLYVPDQTTGCGRASLSILTVTAVAAGG